MDPKDLALWLPIGISALSLILASTALGWNIYRDVILKARITVRFIVVNMLSSGGATLQSGGEFLNLRVVNHGPGPATIQWIAGRITPWWRRLLGRPQYFVILNDHTNPLNPKLPARLDVGDTLNLLLPYDAKCILGTEATDIGVTDSFGREHLAPRKDVIAAKRLFLKAFPPRRWYNCSWPSPG